MEYFLHLLPHAEAEAEAHTITITGRLLSPLCSLLPALSRERIEREREAISHGVLLRLPGRWRREDEEEEEVAASDPTGLR